MAQSVKRYASELLLVYKFKSSCYSIPLCLVPGANECRHVQVTAQLSKSSGQYNNGVISFLLHGEDGSNLSATRLVTDSVHNHNVSFFPVFCLNASPFVLTSRLAA